MRFRSTATERSLTKAGPGKRRSTSIAALAVTAALVGGSMLAATPAYAAPGDPFPEADPLVFIAQQVPTGLFTAVTDASGTVSFAPEGPPSDMQYNAIAYNTADNYVYGYANEGNATIPTGSLIRIGQEGVITRVGTATYPASVIASFGPGGLYYMSSPEGLIAIDVTTGAIVSNTPQSGAALSGFDIAYKDDYFWAAGAGFINRLDPATGENVQFAVPFIPVDDQAGGSWTFGNNNLGFSFNASGTILQVGVENPDAATPTFTLLATSAGPPSGNNDGAASPGQPTDLSLVKTGPEALVPGGTATYTLTVTNNGPGNSSGFIVNDAVPDVLTDVASADGGCTVTGNAVQCVGGRLLAGDSVTYTITASVPDGVTSAVENTATVTANEEDPTPGNNTSTAQSGIASLTLVKDAGDPVDVNGNGIADAGDTIQFTFEVTNSGDAEMADIAIDDPMVGTVSCPEPTLAAGASQVCTADAVYVITEADVDNGSVENTATATGTTPDGASVVSEPSSTSTATVGAVPALTIVKSADPSGASTFVPGQEITYSFAITNTGNVPVEDVAVDEGAFSGTGDLSDVVCPADTLAVGAQMICEATYTLTVADVDSGSVENTATAGGTPPGGEPITSEPSTALVPVEAAPSLSVVKTADVETVSLPGETVTYSFLVTNDGNVSISGVAIDEVDFSGTGELSAIDCPTTTLVAGQFAICTATYEVTQADVDAGTLSNTATAGGTPPEGDPITSPSSTTTVEIPPTPSLTVVKTADAAALTAAGQVVTYTFLVTNTGNVSVASPTVTEGEFSGSGELSEVICPDEPAVLGAGESIECSATYTVVAADLTAGALVNTATASGVIPGGGPLTSEPSTATVAAAGGSGGGGLATTGGDVPWVVAGAAVLTLLLGTGLLLAARRRRLTQD